MDNTPHTDDNNQVLQHHQFIFDYFKFNSKEKSLLSTIPMGFTGQGCLWFTNTAPDGWLICDGSFVLKTDYPRLWLLLGDTWGASNSDYFYLPDMRQRVPVGKHSSGTFNALNNAGGEETHTLVGNEMPSHSHALNESTYTGGGNTVAVGQNGAPQFPNNSNTNATGGGGAHNNLQPYRVVNFIIKT